MVTRVERRLPAAHLPSGKLDLEPGFAQKHLGVGDRVGEKQVAQAGREELDRGGHA
jgi:hypothetical protein